MIIYSNKTPLKALFISTFFLGLILISICIKLYLDDLFIGVWSFALPILSLALIRIGLSESKVKTIELDERERLVIITKESIFKTKTQQISADIITTEFRTPNGNNTQLFPKFTLFILENDKRIIEIKSNFLGWNVEKLKKIHKEVQTFSKLTAEVN
jgi:hypothetical protein